MGGKIVKNIKEGVGNFKWGGLNGFKIKIKKKKKKKKEAKVELTLLLVFLIKDSLFFINLLYH